MNSTLESTEFTRPVKPETIDKITDSLTNTHGDLLLDAFKDPDSRVTLKDVVKDRFQSILGDDSKVEYVMQEIVGMGFIERILDKEPDTTDIRFNGTDLTVKTNKDKYVYKEEPIKESDVVRVIKRFANATEHDFNEDLPRMNVQFGYMRVNAVHRTNAPYGTTMAIRISKPKIVVTEENFNTLADDFILDLAKLCMRSGSNLIMSGAPGSGKTELTKTLIGFLDFKEVIITIEDTAEGHFKLLYPHLDITSWLAEGKLNESDLIDESLRNDCDWLMVTETRSAKAAYSLFKGFLTGAHGLTSIHAGSASEIPSRYYNTIKNEIPLDKEAFNEDFFRTVTLGFHQKREWINGRLCRYIDEVVEFTSDGRTVPIYQRWDEDGIFYSEVPNQISEELKHHFISHKLDISILEGTGLI